MAYFCRNLTKNVIRTGLWCSGFCAYHPFPCRFWIPFLLVLSKGINPLAFGRYLGKPHFLAYLPPESFHGGFPWCLHSLCCSIALALWLNPRIYFVVNPRLILLNQLWGIFLFPYLWIYWVPVADQKTVSFPPKFAKWCERTHSLWIFTSLLW